MKNWKHKCDYCENDATWRFLDPYAEDVHNVTEDTACESNYHYACDNQECQAKMEVDLEQSAWDI